MEKERQLLVNCAMSPDGTILISQNRHDYKRYDCVLEGEEYSTVVDGGTDYIRRGGKYTELSIYNDAPFEVIRIFMCRGGRGKDLDQPLQYVPLCGMSNSWLEAVIDYEEEFRPNNLFTKWYKKELEYREEKDIFIEDK